MKTLSLLILLFLSATSMYAADKDMQVIRERLQRVVLSMDPKNKEDVAKLRDTQKADGSWNDIDYADQTLGTWKAYRHLARAYLLARAFRDQSSRFYLDAGMSAAACAAVRWWITNDPHNPNWWWNQIGVPRTMGEIVLLLGDAMPEQERMAAMPLLKRRVGQRTGQNLLDALVQQVIYGVLEESDSDLNEASKQLAGLLAIQPLGKDGIQSDGSFHQHGLTLYSGGYGIPFASNCGLLAYVLRGTRYALGPDQMRSIAVFLLDGIQWMTRGATFDYGAAGRTISRQEPEPQLVSQRLAATGTLPELNIPDVFRLMSDMPPDRKEEFRLAADRYAKIIGGESDPGVGGIRYFAQSDFLVQNMQDFYLSVRMHSSRLYNTDYPCGGGEGLKSHYLADGCTFIMRSGLEYYRIFPCWDWKRIPGTTELQTPGLLPSVVRRKGTTAFVGGLGGRWDGMACMDFARNTLRARKAWFLSSQECLAIGAGIVCSNKGEVETTVNQCLLKGPVRIRDKTDIRVLKGDSRQILAMPCEVEHDGIVYSFSGQTGNVYVATGARTGDWSEINKGRFKSSTPHACDVFMLGILHGDRPVFGDYIYRIVPNTSLESVRTNMDTLEVVRNTAACQAAVRCKNAEGISVCQAIFYETGMLTPWADFCFEVDQPCMIRLVEKVELPSRRKMMEITLANPAHEALDVTIAVHRQLEGAGAEWSQPKGITRLSIALPGGIKAGTSVTGIFRCVQ